MDLTEEIIGNSILRIKENTPKILKCLEVLSTDAIWSRNNKASNSIGTMIIHLCGNMTQYITSSLGVNKDIRDRKSEFLSDRNKTKIELMDLLQSTTKQSCEVILNLKKEDLLNKKNVQGFSLSGVGNIIHAVEHYSYHTGQIVYLTKMLLDIDLQFYNDNALTALNNGATTNKVIH